MFPGGRRRPRGGVIDIDATITVAHSEKENAAATWKKTFGFHPLLAFLDRPRIAGGEALAAVLRPGNAGANTAADHVQIRSAACGLTGRRCGPAGAGAHRFSRRQCRFRWGAPGPTGPVLTRVRGRFPGEGRGRLSGTPRPWVPAMNADGRIRPDTFIADMTGEVSLSAWPDGSRLIVRTEPLHPGAQPCTTPPATGTIGSPAS